MLVVILLGIMAIVMHNAINYLEDVIYFTESE
uniref:Uncharacterized protein n=2 Tax=unclassified Caudoviricetes TaxID=2788787 RepID=A0A8S5UN32_9CAUD|nr:MAG TPA: hypothetical protein [Siphoviridae sp. ctsus30]DAF95828.1 MAG TPA: hypothetical protein [Siphoviridae sp. ctKGQ3]